ncbi:2Fe-2S iron-sulfur cluster binding domain-containing protein [Parahaliea maris]|uniref:2Fe-2S iron-sulfur cluster binding domain-containing protein n=1 Tax=Parahaliea maris TaxID=2716870 RepID=A0A5C8ZWI4_9GAMM|nr:2Fe-2S iron-sulfur cluster binding domain-containing protein [Parahaliea maris]
MSQYSLSLLGDGSELELTVSGNIDLLTTMQEAGLSVRSSCRNSVCRLCKCRLVEGEISYQGRPPCGLLDRHIAEGYILPCIAFARSDLILDNLSLNKSI